MTNERFHYGVETGRDGRFEVSISPPFAIAEIELDAISPSGQFGSATYKNRPITITLKPASNRLRNLDYFNYDHFFGQHRWRSSSDRIIFQGEGWEIRTSQQIEEGFPNPVVK
jgi:hypothetical protein